MGKGLFSNTQLKIWKELSFREKWYYIGTAILKFLKKYYLTIIFVVAAIVSCFFVSKENQTVEHYVNACNFKTILCLFILMLTVAALMNIKFFKRLSAAILRKIHSLRALVLILVFLPAMFAWFITHDVSLLTFIPFTVVALEMAGQSNKLPKVLILQTLACNLSGTISPIGTLQNIYLWDYFSISGVEFITSCWPIAIAGYGLIFILCLIEKNVDITPLQNVKRTLPIGKTVIYILMFILAIIAIFDFVKTPRLYWIIVPIVCVVILICDRSAYRTVNYQIPILFLAMFVLGANFQAIPAISNFLQKIMNYEFFVEVGSSQVLNNTTAIVLLAPFTTNIPNFLIASAVAKFGSPLTSTANQLVLTTYPSDLTRKVFVKWYLIAEVGFLAWLGGVALMVIYL